MIYIAKANTWFKTGTSVVLIEEIYTDGSGMKHGDFRGIYIVGSCRKSDDGDINNNEFHKEDCSISMPPAERSYDSYWYDQGFKDGDEVLMTELCRFDEFYHCKDEDAVKLARLEIWLQSPEGRDTVKKALNETSEIEKYFNDLMKTDSKIPNIHFDI